MFFFPWLASLLRPETKTVVGTQEAKPASMPYYIVLPLIFTLGYAGYSAVKKLTK
ncbi:MAG: hypothetical protein KAS66_13275 [Candidatus Omnitrophica bacterium]|nr:hypothetical protein [Candidatus Omnitrophota bacterium]